MQGFNSVWCSVSPSLRIVSFLLQQQCEDWAFHMLFSCSLENCQRERGTQMQRYPDLLGLHFSESL